MYKKTNFLLLSNWFKRTKKLHQSSTSFFCPYIYQFGRTWIQRPSDFSFMSSDDQCKSVLYLSVFLYSAPAYVLCWQVSFCTQASFDIWIQFMEAFANKQSTLLNGCSHKMQFLVAYLKNVQDLCFWLLWHLQVDVKLKGCNGFHSMITISENNKIKRIIYDYYYYYYHQLNWPIIEWKCLFYSNFNK